MKEKKNYIKKSKLSNNALFNNKIIKSKVNQKLLLFFLVFLLRGFKKCVINMKKI